MNHSQTLKNRDGDSNMLYFVYDLETTGVKHWRNSIHQLSFQIRDNKEVLLEKDYKVRPNPNAEIVTEALEVGGVTRSQVNLYPDMSKIYKSLTSEMREFVNPYESTEKMHLLGYNNRSFDDQFFRAWFTQNGDRYFGSWFWSDSIDVMVLASDYLRTERHEMENFKLMTVANWLDIEVDESKLHDAVYDLELTWQIYKIVGNIT